MRSNKETKAVNKLDGHKLLFREATEKDINDIAHIEKLCFSDPWSEEMISEDLNHKISKYLLCYLVEEELKLVGYIGYWSVADECQINNVAVHPEYRGSKLGSLLLDRALVETGNKGIKVWVLEVRTSNREAIGLYEKYGFRIVVRRKKYYSDGEDAYIMLRETRKEFLTLAIESSCDETAAAVLSGGRKVLSNVISSQVPIHEAYGGVVPEIASRHHLENINYVVDKALRDAGVKLKDIDLIGVTHGPGLIGALVIGVAAAKGYSLGAGIPLVGVNHMHGHVASNLITYPELEPPFLCLVVSGGHTNIVEMESYTSWKVLGGTRDDAVGEAYDKVARVLGLGYPGGPKIDKIAKEGDPNKVHFKRVYLEKDSFDFSFSGIKTAVLNYVNSERQAGREISVPDVACGFQEAVVEVLVNKTIEAAERLGEDRIVVAGGVAANSRLREYLKQECDKKGIKVYLPEIGLCTDNAAMIGCAAYYKYTEEGEDNLLLDAYASLPF